ncbi:MAG: methyl-accepting chemotaxis protein [Nitrospiraceae bacterium]|nr:methyl-accepting chemotaxis protein [Nitrospiraceae bacterium]
MKVRDQFRFLIAMVFGILVLSNLISFLILSKTSRDIKKTEELSRTLVSAVDTARGAQVNFKKQVQEWKDTLLRGNDPAAFEKYQGNFRAREKDVRDGIAKLKGLMAELGLESTLPDDFLNTHAVLGTKYRDAISHYDKSNKLSYHIVDKMVAGIDRQPTGNMDKIVKFIQDNGKVLLGKSEKKSTAENRLALGVSVAIGIVSLALISLASIFIMKNLLKTLGGEPARVNEAAREITAGNLAVKLEDSADEASLYASIKTMAEKLRTVVNSIKSASDNVASASEELSASSAQMSKGVAQQAGRAAQIAASSEEMSQTVVDIAKNAAQMSASATDTVNAAKEGEEIVEKSVREVKAIAGSVGESSKLISLLAGRSKQIGEIVEVISGIADQTNLLALNAAIEAARAGEQGKGFAVVADEVRKLAEKTAKSTSEISGMIKAIQEEVHQAFSSMENGTKSVETGVEYASRAGQALQKIVNSVSGLQSMIQQIASATEQMSTASSQISGDIESIAGISKESSAASEQMAQSANDLSRLSAGLQQTVGHFRV